MKLGNVFNPRCVLEINYKISSIDAYQNVLFAGDEKGTIYRYQLQPDQAMIIQTNQAQSKSLTKSRIDQIKMFPQTNANLLLKKEGFILQYNQKAGKFECLRERFLLPDFPVTIAFIGNLFYFGISKRNYSVINLDDKLLQVANLIVDIDTNPYLKATENDEILIITNNNFGVVISKDGQMKQKSTIQIQNKSIQIITIFQVIFDSTI